MGKERQDHLGSLNSAAGWECHSVALGHHIVYSRVIFQWMGGWMMNHGTPDDQPRPCTYSFIGMSKTRPTTREMSTTYTMAFQRH